MQTLDDGLAARETRVVALVDRILAQNPAASMAEGQLTREGSLVEMGLTSVDMVNLMLAVEAEFDLTIPASEITPENFRSIAAIDALVFRLRGKAAA